MMGAALIQAPEFAITEEQAREMSKALDAVTGEYVNTVDPKTMAWINLALVFGSTYGGAYMKMNARKKRERAANRQGSVTPINPSISHG
jgi:hypothetical protein